MDRDGLSRAPQQDIFHGRQPAVCRQNRTRCACRLDVSRRHPGTRLGFDRGTIDRRYRGRHRISPMGRLLLGAGLLRSSRKVDRQSGSPLARRRCCAVGQNGSCWCPCFRFGSRSSLCSSRIGSASWSIYRRHPCTRYSPGFVARPLNVGHSKGGHSYGYGAWPHLPEFSSLGLLQFSPATIANCLGWVGILPSTRPSSGICRPSRTGNSAGLDGCRENRTRGLRALSKLMVSSRGGSLRVDAFAQRHRVELGIRGLLLVQVAIENRAKPVRMPVKGVGLWVEAGA
jgi:hypothetical protein